MTLLSVSFQTTHMLAPPKPRPPPHRSLCLRITFSCCTFVTLAFLGLIAAEAAAGGKPSCEHPMLTFIDAKAQRHLPAPVAPAATASWPRKGFDLNRTSSSPRAAARDLSAPAWSFFVGSVTYATPVIDAMSTESWSGATSEATPRLAGWRRGHLSLPVSVWPARAP